MELLTLMTDELRWMLVATGVYILLGLLSTYIVYLYYRHLGLYRVPYRFVFIWPVFLVVFSVGFFVALRRMYENRN